MAGETSRAFCRPIGTLSVIREDLIFGWQLLKLYTLAGIEKADLAPRQFRDLIRRKIASDFWKRASIRFARSNGSKFGTSEFR